MAMLHLKGLTPKEPAQALAALGLCVVLRELRRKVQLSYLTPDPPFALSPYLTVRNLPTALNSVEGLAQHIIEDMALWAASPLITAAPPHLRLTPPSAAPWISAICGQPPREVRQLRGLLDADLTAVNTSGRLRRTRLDFTAGRGQHMDIVRAMCTNGAITAADITAVLSGEGIRHTTGASLLWTGRRDPAAYRAIAPADNPRTHPVGLEWLAWLGLAAFPVREVPIHDRLHWVAWDQPLSPEDVLTQASTAAAFGYDALSLGDVWSAPVRPANTSRADSYWEFGPATVMRKKGATPEPSDSGPLTPDTPIGINNIAQLLKVRYATVQQWITRGLLVEPRWPDVSGRPAWSVKQILWWALDTERKIPALAVPPHRDTEPAIRWIIDWSLNNPSVSGAEDLYDGWFAAQLIHPDWHDGVDDSDDVDVE